jgi:transcriptional regulator with XRE-family HTH domain
MSTSGYGKIERGEIDLTLSKLYKISAIFGVSITDLLYFNVSDIFKNDSKRGIQKSVIKGQRYLIKNAYLI